MTMPPAVCSLTVDDIDGVPDAAALLTAAHHTHPTGRLLGSITLPRTGYTAASFMAVIRISRRRGRVDLVHHHDQVIGVACWITHHAHRRAHTPTVPVPRLRPAESHRTGGLFDDVHHSINRLDMIDLALAVPDDHTHTHLACMGTQTSPSARMIADLLLHHQHQRADRDGHTLYLEAHHQHDRTWLNRLGYSDCGPSLGHPPAPQSHALTRTPLRPPLPATKRHHVDNA
ncbi:hypothetical protein [Actinoplanes sp. NPDC049599]|uniref:hypothetical protein n=1 Tax=Actinoplanes sp. NPDC049599 TaxID=3363903 RepID=UPI00379492DE